MLRDYQQEKINELKNILKKHNVQYQFKTPKTIELTKDQYKVHDND